MNSRLQTQIKAEWSPSFIPAQNGLLQRKCVSDECTDRNKELLTLQRSSINQTEPSDVPPIVHEVLRSPGEPLDPATRDFMEPRFRHDFGRVRVHKDDRAARSAESVGALAYTVGNDIVLRARNYSPATAEGRSILAHELVHVMQQSGISSSAGLKLRIGVEDSLQERESMDIAASAARWEHVSPSPVTALQLFRATHTFSLTFDDGPHAAKLNEGKNLTEKVLNTLKAKSLKAAFFIQTIAKDPEGHSFRANTSFGKELIKRMNDEGHTVGIHTGGTTPHELHPEAQKAKRLEGELESAKSFIKKETKTRTKTGIEPTLVRPPERKFDKDVLATYANVGLSMQLWDIEGDKNCKSLSDLKSQMDRELKRVAKDGWKTTTRSKNLVILYHDINEATSSNLGDMIEFIKVDTKKVSEDEAEKAETEAAKAKKEADTARKIADDAKKKAEAAKKDKAAAKIASEAEMKADTARKTANDTKKKAEAAKKDIGPGDFAPL